jgi:hypothetical protein
MKDVIKAFLSSASRNLHYESDSDDNGARVLTNLANTICPRCKADVVPDKEHLCGNRASKPAVKRKVSKR